MGSTWSRVNNGTHAPWTTIPIVARCRGHDRNRSPRPIRARASFISSFSAWKGQFVFGGRAIDAIYVFERGGEFRQETLNRQGQVITGRWRVFLGKVEIDWDNGGFEHATVTWTNDQTMEWQIVDHNQKIQ